MKNFRANNINSYGRYFALGFWGFFTLFPLYWMAVTAFKKPKDIFQGPFYIPGIDFDPTMRSWEYLSNEGFSAFVRALANSILYASVSAFFAVLLGAFAAYGLARFEYRYGPMKNNDISFMIISQRMMPPIVAVIALYMMYRWAGLLDNRFGMILVYTWYNLPLTVFLLTDFMRRIPLDIEHAAAIDGYSKVSQIWHVMLPLSMPGLTAAYLLSFLFAWNDFLLALMLTFREAQTLPIVITTWSAKMNPQWWLLSAAGIVAVLPPIIAAVILDRYMERQVLRGGTRQT